MFYAINTSTGQCGEVDATDAVPPTLFKNEEQLKNYITKVLEFWMIEAMPNSGDPYDLKLGRCSDADYNQVPRAGEVTSQNISWAIEAFNIPCLTCGCNVGQCPDLPPPGREICAICGPAMAAPRTVYFFDKGGPPPPPPPPDLFGYILDVATSTPALSTWSHVYSASSGFCRPCPHGPLSPGCSVPATDIQDVMETLESEGPWTMFVPDNVAFASVPLVTLRLLGKSARGSPTTDPTFTDYNFDILYYHILAGNYSVDRLPTGQTATLQGGNITIATHPGSPGLTTITGGTAGNMATVTKSIETLNGVIHIVNQVLIPPPGSTAPPSPPPPTPAAGTIMGLAAAAPDLSTFVTAIRAAGLASMLANNTQRFTVFAPTNTAFAALPRDVLAELLVPGNKKALVELLTYHALSPAVISSTGLAKGSTTAVNTLEGDALNVFRQCTDRECKRASRVFINQKAGNAGTSCAQDAPQRPCYAATVTSKDNMASNGVVHLIDAVLLPPGFSP